MKVVHINSVGDLDNAITDLSRECFMIFGNSFYEGLKKKMECEFRGSAKGFKLMQDDIYAKRGWFRSDDQIARNITKRIEEYINEMIEANNVDSGVTDRTVVVKQSFVREVFMKSFASDSEYDIRIDELEAKIGVSRYPDVNKMFTLNKLCELKRTYGKVFKINFRS